MSKEFWDGKYGIDDYRYGTKPNAFVEAQALRVIKPQGKVLCLGAGEGRNPVWLAKQGFEVTALDQSTKGLEKLRRLAGERHVEIDTVESTVEAWQPEAESYDAVVMTFLHLAPDVRPEIHDKVVEALAHGGVVVMEAFTPLQIERGRESGGPPSVAMMYTPEMLRKDFADLDIEVLEEQTVELDEGPSHCGPGEVVRLVARKTG